MSHVLHYNFRIQIAFFSFFLVSFNCCSKEKQPIVSKLFRVQSSGYQYTLEGYRYVSIATRIKININIIIVTIVTYVLFLFIYLLNAICYNKYIVTVQKSWSSPPIPEPMAVREMRRVPIVNIKFLNFNH